jgi:hypothetical protein
LIWIKGREQTVFQETKTTTRDFRAEHRERQRRYFPQCFPQPVVIHDPMPAAPVSPRTPKFFAPRKTRYIAPFPDDTLRRFRVILQSCAETFESDPALTLSKRKDPDVLLTRQVVMFLMLENKIIGRRSGGRLFGVDPATIYSSHRKIKRLMNVNPAFAELIDGIKIGD